MPNRKKKCNRRSEGTVADVKMTTEKKSQKNVKRRGIQEVLHVGDFLVNYAQEVFPQHNTVRNKKEEIISGIEAMDMSMNISQYMQLRRFCSPEQLDVPNEVTVLDIESIRGINRNGSDETVKGAHKYKSSKWLQPPLKGRRDLKPWEDLVLVVRVYEPIRKYSRGSRICNPPPVFLYDLAVLGSQTLDQLRDKINCVSDWSVTEGVTENPAKQTKAKDVFKSGFFFIEGVFYNDFRHVKNHDYSESIRKFAEEKGQGPFLTAVMEYTRFVDLTLRVGYPYLYQHQGECKHIIMFVDIRLLNESDPLVSRNYPFHIRIVRKMSHLCTVCKLHTARWVTHDNERTWNDYCYFCDNCFRSFNYIFRKKIGKFRAYRYYDRAIVL